MKHMVVQQGKYKGADALILGTDQDYFGKALWAIREPITFDYMTRVGTEGLPMYGKIFIANINGQIVALNEQELKAAEEHKTSDSTKGTKGTGNKGNSNR